MSAENVISAKRRHCIKSTIILRRIETEAARPAGIAETRSQVEMVAGPTAGGRHIIERQLRIFYGH